MDPLQARRLAEVMQGLGSPVRLQILSMLREAHPLGDLRVRPERSEAGHRPDRLMSTPTVRRHMAQLLDLGVVGTQRGVRDGRTIDLYEVNRAQLFALTEELLALAQLPGAYALDGTLPGNPVAENAAPERPHLVLVRGVGEGTTFPLERRRGGAWVIGRGEAADIRLSYDGFLSRENSRVAWTGDRFVLEDLPPSRNGTRVNWRALPPGERRELRPGDVVGVGRSLLVFRDVGQPG